MTKWYDKPIEVVTKKNVVTVLLFINSLFFYVIQKIGDNETAKTIGIFSFSMGVGQYIGERIGFKRKKNVAAVILISILVISYIFRRNIGNGEVITIILAAVSLGEEIGFHIGRMRAKRRID